MVAMTVLTVKVIPTVGLRWIKYHIWMTQRVSVATVSRHHQASCKHFTKIKKKMSALESTILTGGIYRWSELHTQQKTHNLFWPDKNSIEQCFAADIVQYCHQY